MKRDKKISLKEHLKMANHLMIASFHIEKIYEKFSKHYPKTSPLIKTILKAHPYMLGGIFGRLKNELDTEYHKVISDEEFKKYGHIYYNIKKKE